jgi:signal peptidase II
LKNYLKIYGLVLALAVVIIVADQITKALVRSHLDFAEFWSPWQWLAPYARIVNWHNTGAAFGMFQSFGGVFTVLAILVSIAILYYLPQVPREDWYLRLAMGMQLGGALGNLIDRLTQGFVTDFVSIGNFPVFNVADASISTGVAILILGLWIKERTQPKPVSSDLTPGDDSETPPSAVTEETRGE